MKGVPPLRTLTPSDFVFLDSTPLDDAERSGRTGRHKDKRRPSKKTYYEMKKLMEYITNKVDDQGALFEGAGITLRDVDAMYCIVESDFDDGDRDAQKKWSSCYIDVTRKERAARRIQGGVARQ